jgi:hypothetical protein
MPDISLSYKLTLEDYLNAQQLHAKRGFWPRTASFLRNWLFPFLGVCFLGIAFLEWRGPANGSVLSSVVAGVLLVGCPFYVRRKYRRFYQRTRTGSGDMSLTFGEDNFLAEKQNFSKGEYNWSAVKSWRENAKVMLLYLAPARFIVIPKRAISEPQLQELRALLERKIMRPT